MIKRFIVPLLLIVLGAGMLFTGALFKIMHWPNASLLMWLGDIASLFSIGSLIYIFFKTKK